MAVGEWRLERTGSQRFPFRLKISGPGQFELVLRVQDRWPGANRNIFCLQENEPPPSETLEELERVPVIALQRRGRRLSVVLDRARNKRCDFLFLARQHKDGRGEYQQVYWQTQASMRQRRPGVHLSPRAASEFTVRIASDERYPWRFPGCGTERGRLAAGDYALVEGDTLLAVVERKTLENLLADFGTLPVLHQRLMELAVQPQAAMVVEAQYEDFLQSKKVHHYTPAFCAAAIAELYATHPGLPIVFCANRKMANLWTQHFFAAVWAAHRHVEQIRSPRLL